MKNEKMRFYIALAVALSMACYIKYNQAPTPKNEVLASLPVAVPVHLASPDYEPPAQVVSGLFKPEYERRMATPQQKYIIDYYEAAQLTQWEYGVPASITLAQGILESSAGNSKLAKECNNHFGIKCFSKVCESDHCKNYHDDSHKDFFINYQDVMQSYEHHGEFLNGNRYKHLLELDIRDYKGWAKGLKKAGYATNPEYDKKIIRIIEKYDLTKFDLI